MRANMKKVLCIYTGYVTLNKIYCVFFHISWHQGIATDRTYAPESELTSNFIWEMEWTGQNFCNGGTYQFASSPESQLWFLFCFLSLWVCMNDFSANFLLISYVTGNRVITWELWSRCSVSILVQASSVLSQQDPAVPYHCNVCLPSANMLCIQMCQDVSQSKFCT